VTLYHQSRLTGFERSEGTETGHVPPRGKLPEPKPTLLPGVAAWCLGATLPAMDQLLLEHLEHADPRQV